MNILKITLLSVLVVFFSFLNFLNISILGVKPDFALAAVIAILFFADDFLEGIFYASVSALIVKFSPGAGSDILIYFFICVFAVLIKKYLPWENFIGVLAATALSTFLFYVFILPNFIVSAVFIKEMAYNVIVSGLLFFALSSFKVFKTPNRKIFTRQ